MPYNGAADRSCSAAPTELQGRDARHGCTTAISRAADPTAALAAPVTMASAMLDLQDTSQVLAFTGARLHRCSPSQVLAPPTRLQTPHCRHATARNVHGVLIVELADVLHLRLLVPLRLPVFEAHFEWRSVMVVLNDHPEASAAFDAGLDEDTAFVLVSLSVRSPLSAGGRCPSSQCDSHTLTSSHVCP